MYLKALELDGFKSFSNRTVIEFTKGITSIVGPNGSGKSNILDAILWVLGEQSYKSIRASMSSDVIFSGGKNKRAANSAEVSLIIENSDRYLDIESDEVKITRRIYKNGDGEYLINNKKARLKDIHNIFMDTGIGKQAYSIIGQGRVERIISSNPKEIREILEEAAGTKRAKVEKEEAIKRLNNVSQELEKISFVEKELSLRVKRLKDESEKASFYQNIVNQILVKSFMLYEYNTDKINVEQEKLSLDKKNIEKEIEDISNNLELENERLKDFIENRNRVSELLDNLKLETNNIFIEFNNEKEKLSKIELDKSNFEVKLNEKLQIKDKLLVDKNKNIEKLKDYEIQINTLTKDVVKKEEKKKELTYKIEEITSKTDELNKKIEIKDNESKEIELLNYRIKIENEELERKVKLSENNILNLEKERKEILLAKDKIELEIAKLNNEYEDQVQFNKDISNKYSDISKELEDLKNRRKEIVEIKNRKLLDYDQKNNQYASIQKTLEDNYFLSTASKYILKTFKNDDNIIDSVSNILSIKEEYLVAISGLIGFSLNDIVVKNTDKTTVYIDDLKKNKVGTVSFLPLDNIKTSSKLDRLPNVEGVVDFARNLVSSNIDINLDKLILHLFSNAIVVKDINAATKVLKIGFSDRIITIEGDIFSSRGRLTGGYKKNKVDLTLQKKDELTSKEKELNTLKEEIKNLDSKYDKINLEIDNLSNNIDTNAMSEANDKFNAIKKNLEYKKTDMNSIERKLLTINYEIDDTKGLIVENKNRIDKNSKLSMENIEKLDEIFDKRQDLEIEIAKLESVEKYQKKLNEVSIDYAVLNEKLTNIKNINDELTLDHRNLEKDLNDIEKFEHNKDELFLSFNQEIELYTKNIETLNITRLNNLDNISKYENEVKDIEKNETDSVNRRNDMEKEILKKSSISEKIAENIVRNEKELENLEEKINEINDKKSDVKLDEIYYKLEDDNLVDIKQEISKLESKKNNIGSVNLASIEEYNSEFERHQVLVNQRDDLINSSNSINDLISKIDKDITEKFTYAFNEIKENFKYMCSEIFYGARGDIKLTDPSNILTTGLELSVKYKNKPEQTLMLLSGGEKSMLAVSFIMAIFMFKPSPFTFFDEIEAALDERNTKKIIELLRRFIEKSQFILITHNKETMKGSDRLYGVSMNKEVGESRIVSVDI
ncbi:chromosome segregation protein SMC [Pseudostreptobacillus hongkongensis]|uniref:chromosome segregation protein SMC n=1 Tax=Pseudostreptobacillus hongkongensis TaxID=1162717 RepID=UPI000833B25F|nr:chromosome segregation protein SMC [Pseudostreptobacillus hongkongensis]